MKKHRIITGIIACFLITALCATGCGGSKAGSSASYAAEEAIEEDYDGGTYGAMASADEAYATGETADYYENGTAAKGEGEAKAEAPEAVEAAESNQKLVYTCWMTIQTLEFSETQTAVKDAVKKVGGIIEAESVSDSDYSWYYDTYKKSGTLSSSLTIRVPSEKYEEFLNLLDGAGGKVTKKSQNVENITKRYNDQTIYIQSLETQEQRLLTMMEQAETVEEMITVEERLTDVQTELNQARSSLASMDTDVKYSTVNLNLEEVVKYTNTPKTPLTFGERLTDAFVESWENFASFLQDAVIAIIYMFPMLLLIAVVAVIIIFARKAWRKKHPKVKKEKTQNQRGYNQRSFFRRPGAPTGGPNGQAMPPAGGPNGQAMPPAGGPNGQAMPPMSGPNGQAVPPVNGPNGQAVPPVNGPNNQVPPSTNNIHDKQK